jgi:glycine/D-amino acid oxidase-like deaminating enzyme
MLESRFSREAARAVHRAMVESVDEVGRVCADEGIDAQYVKGGSLRLARGRHQLPAIERAYATYERFGLADDYHLLNADETAARIHVTDTLGALFTPHCATVHPGRLVRGLARAVERHGGTIYEQTAVTTYETGARPCLHTATGDVRARIIVLAGESYLSQLAPLHRTLIPIYSLIVLTEPLSAAQWAAIGWEGHDCVSSNRYTVDYLSRTADGRILFGGRGAPYRYGSRIADAYDRHAPTHAILREQTRLWFPALADIRFTHAWGGPLGVPRDWLPTMTYDSAAGLATACGYTGQGVATANLSGRVLADQIAGAESPLVTLPTVGHRHRAWEREPLRWLGVRFVQRGYARLDARAERTGEAPTGDTLAERLGQH